MDFQSIVKFDCQNATVNGQRKSEAFQFFLVSWENLKIHVILKYIFIKIDSYLHAKSSWMLSQASDFMMMQWIFTCIHCTYNCLSDCLRCGLRTYEWFTCWKDTLFPVLGLPHHFRLLKWHNYESYIKFTVIQELLKHLLNNLAFKRSIKCHLVNN